ncbi:hypothetical protein EMCRGX_G010501 [Ephydatia muelleri]
MQAQQGAAYLPQGPTQGGVYPPQGGVYPPQGGVYPPQGGVYPPRGRPTPGRSLPTPGRSLPTTGRCLPQPSSILSTRWALITTGSTVVFVQPQPTVTTAVFTPVGDYYYTTSIVLSFICFFCGTWWSLCCTIPAIFVASSARDAAARGDLEGARRSGQTALGLNIAAVVFYVIIWAVIIGLAAGLQSTAATTCYYNSYGRYTCY